MSATPSSAVWSRGSCCCLAAILVLLLAGEQGSLGQSASNADAVFRKLDSSGDGRLTMDEATVSTRSLLERVFKQAGKQASDSLSRDEFRAAYERLHAKPSAGGAKSATAGSAGEPAKASQDATPPEGLRFLDSDGDGSISKAEWSKLSQSFSRLDVDKDTFLDNSELGATGGAAELLKKLADANGDGKIARLEWARLVKNFSRYDANHDGALDEAELNQAAESNLAAASGSASLPGGGKSAANSGPTLWRGRIEGRSEVELLISGNMIEGREIGPQGVESLGAGTFSMTGDGKSGNMDAVYTEGPRAGQVCLGIYRIEGDTVRWCVNNRGVRPQEMRGGQGSWMLTLTRVDDSTPGRKSR